VEADYYVRPPFKHVRMPVSQRAKQFAPFAALTTFDSAIEDEEIKHEKLQKKVLSEESMSEIDKTLCAVNSGDRVEICFFIEGRYMNMIASVLVNDRITKSIRVSDDSNSDIDFVLKIPYADIYRISKL